MVSLAVCRFSSVGGGTTGERTKRKNCAGWVRPNVTVLVGVSLTFTHGKGSVSTGAVCSQLLVSCQFRTT